MSWTSEKLKTMLKDFFTSTNQSSSCTCKSNIANWLAASAMLSKDVNSNAEALPHIRDALNRVAVAGPGPPLAYNGDTVLILRSVLLAYEHHLLVEDIKPIAYRFHD